MLSNRQAYISCHTKKVMQIFVHKGALPTIAKNEYGTNTLSVRSIDTCYLQTTAKNKYAMNTLSIRSTKTCYFKFACARRPIGTLLYVSYFSKLSCVHLSYCLAPMLAISVSVQPSSQLIYLELQKF